MLWASCAATNASTQSSETVPMFTEMIEGRPCLSRSPSMKTSRRAWSFGSIEMTASPRKAWAAFVAMSAPARLSSCNGSDDLSHARTRCPALSRFAAMTLPIRPVPRNPTSIVSILQPHGQLGPARHAPLPTFVFDLRHESLAIISSPAERSARGSALCARDQVRNLRRPCGLKSPDRLLDRSIRLGHPLVLPQVLEPRFHEERFQHAPFFGSILKNAPRIGTVAATLLAELFDRREKQLTITRIDSVFDRDEHRALIALDVVRKHRRRPVH